MSRGRDRHRRADSSHVGRSAHLLRHRGPLHDDAGSGHRHVRHLARHHRADRARGDCCASARRHCCARKSWRGLGHVVLGPGGIDRQRLGQRCRRCCGAARTRCRRRCANSSSGCTPTIGSAAPPDDRRPPRSASAPTCEYRLRRGDGSWIDLRQNTVPLEDVGEADGTGSARSATLDVTAQKQRRDASCAKRRRSSGGGRGFDARATMAVLDPDGIILDVNEHGRASAPATAGTPIA